MDSLYAAVQRFLPDGLIYLMIAIVFIAGVIKCCRPLLRNGRSLRQASELLVEGAKAKLGKPIWFDASFLGRKLKPIWTGYLQNADMGRASGVSSDVAEYVREDNVIQDAGNAPLAELIPGICTSLGILGTFLGLSMGLAGLDVMEIDSYTRLTAGIAIAFNTSIVGIIVSLLFNILYRYSVGRARRSLDDFIATFYLHGIPQPPDMTTQLLTYEREQSDAMAEFTQDLGGRMGQEINRAISQAMAPVQRTMDAFITATTRAQLDGLDHIVARFIDRMNKVLGDELSKLGKTLRETTDGQAYSAAQLREAMEAIGALAGDVTEIHSVSEQMLSKFASYVGDMGDAYRRVSESRTESDALLADIGDAAARQASYLSALQEYQQKLQASFHDYTLWTDQYVTSLDARTEAQNASLSQIAGEMHASATMLSGAFKSFTEAIELGLSNSLGALSEGLKTQLKQVEATISRLDASIARLEKVAASSDKGVS